jgi:iron complex outermembrane receptor protein
MNTKLIRYSILILLFISGNAMAQNVLTGKVFTEDKSGRVSVPNASLYIEDLKLAVGCDSGGVYSFSRIPAGTYLVEVHGVGIATTAEKVTVRGTVTHDFIVTPAAYEQEEVVVTGTSSATNIRSTPQSITEVPHDYLEQTTSTNIIDALKRVPGVDGISDGQSIAKPTIRGLGGNRVITLNDGVRQEGQQWGDEFGIEVDQNSVNRAEILKGPASLVYGSDAISGVINLLPEKTAEEGTIKGNILYNYQTNNGLMNSAAHVAGNLNGIYFSARVDNTMAHAYQNKNDGYVFNSQFSNFNTDGTIGIQRKWGFSQLHYSYFELRTGIVEGAKNDAGHFVKQAVDQTGQPIEGGIEATNQELRSYTPFVINQLVKHNRLVWDNSVSLGNAGRITGTFAMQDNSRQENNDITIANTSNIWYHLNTYNYDLRYISRDWNNFNFSVGANGMYQNSTNKGTLLLIPEYDLFDFGAFAIANKKAGKFNISAGIRYQMRTFNGHDNYADSNGNALNPTDPAAIHQFNKFSTTFNGVAGSLGATFQASKSFYIKANVASGWRAPNVAEAASNGIKDGTVVYEIGDANLKPEQSIQFDFTPGFHSKDFTAEVSFFYNSISNFIYQKQLGTADGTGDSINNNNPAFPDAPVFKYSQTDATLVGGEVFLDLHPSGAKWFDWYAGYSIVDARLKNVPDSVNVLPFVQPAKLRTEFTFTAQKIGKIFRNSYIRVGMNYTFEQDRVYQLSSTYYGLDKIEKLPAYTLLNVGIGTDIMNHGKKTCSLYINVDNLTDVAYTDYMSRFKYVVNTVNGGTQKYVYNMGRNVSVKVIFPLNIYTRHKANATAGDETEKPENKEKEDE